MDSHRSLQASGLVWPGYQPAHLPGLGLDRPALGTGCPDGHGHGFHVGFKNNATYSRLWEARQIWGAIVNGSRAFGLMIRDSINSSSPPDPYQDEKTALFNRHYAWLTALRYQMREPRVWENMHRRYNVEYAHYYQIPERITPLEDALKPYLCPKEYAYILGTKNKATQLLALQSAHLRRLQAQGAIDTYLFGQLQLQIANLVDQQGKSERLKGFPYPRQFSSLNSYFVQVFCFLVPLGMLQEFTKLADHNIWLTVPLSTLICWIFTSMDKVGESSENPFEGGANDVPISAISRTIEIDMREMLGETDLPEALKPVHNILM